MKQEEQLDNYWSKLAYDRQDLSTCESEPIQFCGAIQDCGYFLAFDFQGSLIAISENFLTVLDVTVEQGLGTDIKQILQFEDGSDFSISQALEDSEAGYARLKTIRTQEHLMGNFFHAKSHICVDLEPIRDTSNEDSSRFVDRLRKLVFQIDSESDVELILFKAADQIRSLTLFDRVMVYRFEPNWDGSVIAESVDSKFESFLDLHYPASDIPQQARDLYLHSKYRMIADTASEPVPVRTKKGLSRAELDLSCSSLRAISPFHIQYLRNMGVRASFSIPIKVDGKLWGLVACHGYEKAQLLSRELRSCCELAGQVLSGRITDYNNDRRLKVKNQILSLSQSIVAYVTDGKTPIQAFAAVGNELMKMTESDGVLIRIANETIRIGSTPDDAYVDSVIQRLKDFDSLSMWTSDHVSAALGLPEDPAAVGITAVPFSFGFEDLIMWFRPEFVRQVKWGGHPTEKATSSDQLNPRASFREWVQTVNGRSREWSESSHEAAQHLLFMFVRGMFLKAAELSKANIELARLTQAKDEFIGLVSHELRSPLGIIIGWIDILKIHANSDPKVLQAIEIIERNSHVQINLINDLLDASRIISGKMRINPKDNLSIGDVIRNVERDLAPTAQIKAIQVKLNITDEILARGDPDRIRQMIWNLVSNAIKFTPKNGVIDINLRKRESSYVISVKDSGIGIESSQLTKIFDRFAQAREGHASLGGLGLGLSIVKVLVELHGGSVSAYSEGKDQGSTFTIDIPIFTVRDQVSEKTVTRMAVIPSADLEGLRILVAEDQNEAALALDFYLRRAGAKTTLVFDGQQALAKMMDNDFDLLLSDVGMPNVDGIELISRIRRLEKDRRTKSLPAIALTAFATPKDRARCLEAGFQNHIAKPVDREELLAVIRTVLPKSI